VIFETNAKRGCEISERTKQLGSYEEKALWKKQKWTWKAEALWLLWSSWSESSKTLTASHVEQKWWNS